MPRAPGEPVIHGVNWLGIQTLYLKEVRRFFKVQMQAVWAPAITTLMFLAIFTLALGPTKGEVLGVPYVQFLAPGLIIMGMAQNAFQNSLSSIIIAKVQGTIVDVLMPPLGHGELLFCYVAGAVTRAWAVGLAIWGAMWLWPGVDVSVVDPLQVLLFGTLGGVLLGLLGVLTGIWADKFDHGAAVTNFVVQPLTLLSGTFYAIDRLPPTIQSVSRANPFFYMIDGFRAGFIGAAEAPVWLGIALLAGLCALLWLVALALLRSGWKLRP
ncbi:MAG: ABC transporter permease [Sphingomonadaceae bacterium]